MAQQSYSLDVGSVARAMRSVWFGWHIALLFIFPSLPMLGFAVQMFMFGEYASDTQMDNTLIWALSVGLFGLFGVVLGNLIVGNISFVTNIWLAWLSIIYSFLFPFIIITSFFNIWQSGLIRSLTSRPLYDFLESGDSYEVGFVITLLLIPTFMVIRSTFHIFRLRNLYVPFFARRVREILAHDAGAGPAKRITLTANRTALTTGVAFICLAVLAGIYAVAMLYALFMPKMLAVSVPVIPIASILNVLSKATNSEYGELIGFLDSHRSTVAATSALVMTMATILLWRSGLRRIRASALRLMQEDARSLVLLLRSFQDDAVSIRSKSILSQLLFRKLRLEEAVGDELFKYGPFIAVGAPSEKLPLLGAYRVYLTDDDWQQSVTTWINESRLIVVIAGLTKWVEWEIATAIKENAAGKLLILIPPGNQDSKRQRLEVVQRAFGTSQWQHSLGPVDPNELIALYFGEYGKAFAVTSKSAHESDYEVAVRFATFGMFFPSDAGDAAASGDFNEVKSSRASICPLEGAPAAEGNLALQITAHDPRMKWHKSDLKTLLALPILLALIPMFAIPQDDLAVWFRFNYLLYALAALLGAIGGLAGLVTVAIGAVPLLVQYAGEFTVGSSWLRIAVPGSFGFYASLITLTTLFGQPDRIRAIMDANCLAVRQLAFLTLGLGVYFQTAWVAGFGVNTHAREFLMLVMFLIGLSRIAWLYPVLPILIAGFASSSIVLFGFEDARIEGLGRFKLLFGDPPIWIALIVVFLLGRGTRIKLFSEPPRNWVEHIALSLCSIPVLLALASIALIQWGFNIRAHIGESDGDAFRSKFAIHPFWRDAILFIGFSIGLLHKKSGVIFSTLIYLGLGLALSFAVYWYMSANGYNALASRPFPFLQIKVGPNALWVGDGLQLVVFSLLGWVVANRTQDLQSFGNALPRNRASEDHATTAVDAGVLPMSRFQWFDLIVICVSIAGLVLLFS